MTWADLLSRQDLHQVNEVALRWADPRHGDDRIRQITDEALAEAAGSYDRGGQTDFLVHALTVLRRHLREAGRALPGVTTHA